MERILNLTQHSATPEQVNVGLVDLNGEFLKDLKENLTFNIGRGDVTKESMFKRAQNICGLVKGSGHGIGGKVMIGGAPYFMSILESVLIDNGYRVTYSLTDRVVEELGDGTKISKFKHIGFYDVV